jgi:hypothetical protein
MTVDEMIIHIMTVDEMIVHIMTAVNIFVDQKLGEMTVDQMFVVEKILRKNRNK